MVKFRSTRLIKRKRKLLRLKLIYSFLIVIFGILFLASVSQLYFLNIKKVAFFGNEIVSNEKLLGIVKEKTMGKYYWLFSKKNIFIYPKEEIRIQILNEFPRVKNVDFNLGLEELNILIEERQPFALWCDVENKSEECFLIDDESYIFATSSFENNYFKYYKKLDVNNLLKERVFEVEKFEDIKSFIGFVEGLNLNPYKLIVSESQNEIYFGDGSRIIFDNNQDIKEVINNLQSVLNMEEFEDIKNFKKLEYIDLRFGNKVFYK